MGTFLLVRQSDSTAPSALAEKAVNILTRQGFENHSLIRRQDYTVYLFDKLVAPTCNHVEFADGDFCAATGTLLYQGLTGEDALHRLYEEFNPNKSHSHRLYGSFCIIVRKNAITHLVIDRLGVYKAYVDDDYLIWSNSFLALCAALPRLDLDTQSLYEYVFQGATYGNRTLFANINLVDADTVYQIDKTVELADRSGRIAAQTNNQPVKAHVAQALRDLRIFYKDIAACFGDNIDTALSGGYDSRLTLALLLEQGVRPKVHVYGNKADLDVLVAKKIDAKESLGLAHVDKSQYSQPSVGEFPNTVEANFLGFDGCPTDGIFNNGADLVTRKERCANGELMLNGGGGEVFRNFFYLRNRPFTVRQLLWTFYSRFDPSVCSDRFSEEEYHSTLANKVKSVLGTGQDLLTRAQIEAIYPMFRCRYWMGRNNAVNNRFGSALTPFIDYAIVRNAVTIPLFEKYFGEFEARLIRAVSPTLAAHKSAYGHNFAEQTPWKRKVSESLVYARPPRLRRYSYRLQLRSVEGKPLGLLSEEYRRSVLQDDCQFLNEFFNVADVRDLTHFNRICTLEYLLQRYASKVDFSR